MKHPRVNPLIGRISGLMPVLAAITLGWSSVSASADAVTDLDRVFQTTDPTDPLYPGYAAEEGVPVTQPAKYGVYGAPNVVTASATDLVYAVYKLAQTSTYNSSPSALSSLVAGALQGIETNADGSPKYLRSDLNVIAPRVLNAALIGAGFTGSNAVTVTESLVNLNNQFNLSNGKPNTHVQLTVAGKEAVLAQGLKSVGTAFPTDATNLGAFAVATFSALVPSTASQTAKDLQVQQDAGAVLKLVGSATGSVPYFTRGILSSLENGQDHTAYALKIAEFAAANPAAAGAVIGGRAIDLGNGATQDQYTTLLRSAFNDAKLATAHITAFASVATQVGGDQTSLGQALFDTSKNVATFGKAVAATTLNKAQVTAGVIQGLTNTNDGQPLTSTQVQNVFTSIGQSIGTPLKTTEFATFAGTAATGTGDSAALLARVLINAQYTTETAPKTTGGSPTPPPTTAVDTANRVAIGVAALKAVATSSPTSGEKIAVQVIASGNGGQGSNSSVFSTDTELTALGKSLAAGVKATNGALIGSTVEGVASQLTGQSLSNLADFVTAVTPSAPSGAVNITQAITTKLILPGGSTGITQFATTLGGKIGLAYAANAIAGIAAADPTDAGSIADAAGRVTALKPLTLALGTAMATALPEERVVDVAVALANLLKPLPSHTPYDNPNDPNNAYDKTVDPKEPTIAVIPTLAANIAKVIQTKPLMLEKYRTWELSELAASLVTVAVQKIPAGATDAATAKAMEPTVAAIGSSIIAALSPVLLQNDAPLAADKQDALQQVAGAVFQAVAACASLSDAVKHALLDQVADPKHPGSFLPGPLEAALVAKAGTAAFQNLVKAAFSDVLAALNDPNNSSHIVPGSYAPGTNSRYACGNVFEPETPVNNFL